MNVITDQIVQVRLQAPPPPTPMLSSGATLQQSGKCVICNGPGVSDAALLQTVHPAEKDRDGCPKIVNLSSACLDMIYERKKYLIQATSIIK